MSDTAVVTQQDVDDPQLDPNAADDGAVTGGAADEPFLKVSDRQVFKTREDAVKSYEEAGKMGVAFGEFKKVLKEYGIANADPAYVRQLFGELVGHRKAKETAAAKPKSPTDSTGGNANVDPEVEKARKWLKDNAKEAGYVSKEDFDKLTEKLAGIEGGLSTRDKESRDALLYEGQQAVNGWMESVKGADGKPLTLDEDQRNELEETIGAWVNVKQERIDRFYKGGNTSIALIKEGFTKVLPALFPGAVAFPNPGAKVAAAGKAKAELMQRSTKRLPQDGGGNDAKGKGKKPERVGDPALHNRVTDKLSRLLSGNDDE